MRQVFMMLVEFPSGNQQLFKYPHGVTARDLFGCLHGLIVHTIKLSNGNGKVDVMNFEEPVPVEELAEIVDCQPAK